MGVLLRGPSGVGKSDLALRLLAAGAQLVADDQVLLRRNGRTLVAEAVQRGRGLIEVRGIGPLRVPATGSAPLGLVVDLVPAAAVPRLPESDHVVVAGLRLPRIRLAPLEASAPAKLRLVVAALSGDIIRRVMTLVPHDASGHDSAEPGNIASESDGTEGLPPPGDAPGSASGGASGGASATRAPVLLVTGMSGAGRSTALKALEDIGYEAVDNLPLSLLADLVDGSGGRRRPLAIGVDIRTRDFAVPPLLEALDRLMAAPDADVRLLFVDCDDEVLRRRYSETRRRHPLAADRPVLDGIALERRQLASVRDRADQTVDTTALSPGEFKGMMQGWFALDAEPGLAVFVTSFSYRNGLPREADLVFDVRFLDNPHYDPLLRPQTGRDAPVGERISADPGFPAFFSGLTGLLLPLLPRYAHEGKSYLTLAVGCTGGRHRSVYVAERLGAVLAEAGYRVAVAHRDLAHRDLVHRDLAHRDLAGPDGGAA